MILTKDSILKNLIIFSLSLQTTLTLHINRKDLKFLKLAQLPFRKVFLIEYFLLNLLILLVFLIKFDFLFFFIDAFSLVLISYIPPIQFKNKQFILAFEFLPKTAFDWKVGLRKNLIFILIIYALGIIFSQNTFVIPSALFLLTFLSLQFPIPFEARNFVEVFGKSPQGFIWFKTFQQVKLWFLLIFPLLLLFSILHFNYFKLLTIGFLIGVSWQFFIVFSKYSFYSPQGFHWISYFFLSLMLIFWALPLVGALAMPLVILLMTIWFYFKALRNLNNYI